MYCRSPFKGANKTMNPSDFIFSKGADEKLRVQIATDLFCFLFLFLFFFWGGGGGGLSCGVRHHHRHHYNHHHHNPHPYFVCVKRQS